MKNDRPVTLTGGRALAEMLKVHDVGPMFGMGGFQLLPFYEAVRVLGLRHHLINDERCGAFAADAYARVTGKPGVCDGTLGPGAINLATALVESLNAGVPVIAITGNANRGFAGRNMTQEAQQLEILRPAVKEVIRIEVGKRIPEHVRRAYAVATSGRPGPVVIDVPEDIAHGEFEFDPNDLRAAPGTTEVPARRTRPEREALARAAKLLDGARRPLLLVGGGVHLSRAYDALAAIAQERGIPVAYTLSGKGAIASTSPLSAGLFGRYSRIANDLIESSDCLVVVGCKLGEIATKRYTLPPAETPMIHIDISAEEIGRWQIPTVALWSDAREALVDLLEATRTQADTHRDYLQEVRERMASWRREAEPRLTSEERPVNMGRLINELNRVMPADSILVADGGFAAHWSGLLYDTKKAGRTFIADRGLASIGYGLPGALGAAIATGDDTVVVGLTGDGGLNMVLGELETARRLNARFTLVVVNNAASGYVKALQHAMYGGNYQSSDLKETNYAHIAEEFGCLGIRVEAPGQLAAALERALAHWDGPAVVDVAVTRDPERMLPAADNRTLVVNKGDRPV